MKAFILILVLLVVTGCVSTTSSAVEQTPEGVVLLSQKSLDGSPHDDRILGNLRSSFSRHLKDCREGVEFTYRSVARNSERGWRRLAWLVD